MATEAEFTSATTVAAEALHSEPLALAARYDAASNTVIVQLNTGYTVAFSPQRSQALHEASPADLARIEIDLPGSSIYFPSIEDGLLVASLAHGRFGSDRWEAAWAAAHRADRAA